MRKNSLIQLLFFGNYFYGICAVALSMETALVLQFPLQDFFYYLFIFASTTVFYTIAYLSEAENQYNPRSIWYIENKKWVRISQYVLSSIAFLFLLQSCFFYWKKINLLPWQDFLLMAIFPLVAMAYYGISADFFSGCSDDFSRRNTNSEPLDFWRLKSPLQVFSSKTNIRQIGWIKPFVIGFVWAGTVNIYPFFYEKIKNSFFFVEEKIFLSLFLENFLFISVLGIMFDIKDYATDSNEKIKTFVVQHGLRKTIFYIIFPLVLLGLTIHWRHFWVADFSYQKALIQSIPFVLLLVTAYSLRQRKSILYYLILVDGLILVKVFCTCLEKNIL
jgi:hypothetical protein